MIEALGAELLVTGLISTGVLRNLIRPSHRGGLCWVAPAVALAVLTGLAGAWGLLIEVVR